MCSACSCKAVGNLPQSVCIGPHETSKGIGANKSAIEDRLPKAQRDLNKL